jgi:hypothetical protein
VISCDVDPAEKRKILRFSFKLAFEDGLTPKREGDEDESLG